MNNNSLNAIKDVLKYKLNDFRSIIKLTVVEGNNPGSVHIYVNLYELNYIADRLSIGSIEDRIFSILRECVPFGVEVILDISFISPIDKIDISFSTI